MQQLSSGVEECLARKDLRCPRTNPPFRYGVRITGEWPVLPAGW